MAAARLNEARLKQQHKRFEAVFKRPENQECFECTSKQPRWASTNLGVIFCLRCAGVHRSLGVHITKVKSTKMDLWEDDMIETVEKIGNAGGKLLYEAKMPRDFKKPQESTDTKQIEKLLIQKYDKKMWYADDFDVIRASLMDQPSHVTTPALNTAAGGGGDWGDFHVSPVSPAGPPPPATPPVVSQQQSKSSADDFWGTFQASPTLPVAQLHQQQQQRTATQQTPVDSLFDFSSGPSTANGAGNRQATSTVWGAPVSSPTMLSPGLAYVPQGSTHTTPIAPPAPTSSFLDFGPPATTPAVAPATNGGGYQRSSNTQAILDAFGPPQCASSWGHNGARSATQPAPAAMATPIWASEHPQQQQRQQQQPQFSSFF